MSHYRLTSESQHEQKDLLFLHFRRKRTAVGNVSFFPHSDCLVRSQGQLKIWPPSEIRGVLQFLSLSLEMIYHGLPCRRDCGPFLSSILCKAGTVLMEVVFLSGSHHRYQFCYVCKTANPIAARLSPWKGRLKTERRLISAFWLYYNQSDWEKLHLHLSNTVIQYNTTQRRHTATQCALRSNIDKKPTIRRAIRIRLDRTKDWRC